MEDDSIVNLYWARSENAISETSKKYGKYCYSIAYGILGNVEDADESVNDTYLDAWNNIPPHRPSILSTFLGKITRRISIDKWRDRTAGKRGGGEITLVLEELVECLSGGKDAAVEYESKELEECIQRFVRTLPEQEGNIFLRRYFFNKPAAVIAREYGMTKNNVTVILSRTRKKLRRELEKEGYL